MKFTDSQILPPGLERSLRFYVTNPSPCPYLPGLKERKAFTNLAIAEADAVHNSLSQAGFRRSQTIAYRPACARCNACRSVRVPTREFALSRNDRRALKRNETIVRRPVEEWGFAGRRLQQRAEEQRAEQQDEHRDVDVLEESHQRVEPERPRRRERGDALEHRHQPGVADERAEPREAASRGHAIPWFSVGSTGIGRGAGSAVPAEPRRRGPPPRRGGYVNIVHNATMNTTSK